MHRLPRRMDGDSGTETGNAQVGGGPRVVDKSGNRVAMEAGDRCMKISNIF